MEALAAKERERQQAEERAHAKRLAAMGEAVPDDQAKQVRLPYFQKQDHALSLSVLYSSNATYGEFVGGLPRVMET